MNVVALLRQLCAIDSTSARTNALMIDALDAALGAKGLVTRRHRYLDAAGTEKQNLIALAGPADARPGLALVGHTDCVPFDPAWAEALALTEREGKLFARGACDTKGFIAAALTAVSALDLTSLRQPLALIFTADEEVGCVGAKHLAEARALSPRFAIVGEPTSLRPIRATKGYCLAEIELIGREGHSAYPEVGTSAIRAAARVIAGLDGVDAELRTLTDADFQPAFTTTNVGLISGGKAKNIIPGACKLTLEWRPLPGQPSTLVEDRVRALLERVVADEPLLRYTLDAQRADPGFATSSESPLVAFLARESGRKPDTVAFGTEGPQLAELGAEVVVFGPGDISVAHRTGEFVPRDELETCAEILGRAIQTFCGA